MSGTNRFIVDYLLTASNKPHTSRSALMAYVQVEADDVRETQYTPLFGAKHILFSDWRKALKASSSNVLFSSAGESA